MKTLERRLPKDEPRTLEPQWPAQGKGRGKQHLAAVQKGPSPHVLGKLFHVEVDVVIELTLLLCHGSHGVVDAGDEDSPLVVYQAA